MPLSRRALLGAGLAVAASPVRALPMGFAAAASPAVNQTLLRRALDAVAKHNDTVWARDVLAIADFGLPSSAPRFHIIDNLAGKTTSLMVTHGQGSDPLNTGSLQYFSDTPDSFCTSEGSYLAAEEYSGRHGLSRRLLGLDPSNAHVYVRNIVIHSAPYADPSMIPAIGKLGRSDGCFVFSEQDIPLVLAKVGQGRMIYAGRA